MVCCYLIDSNINSGTYNINSIYSINKYACDSAFINATNVLTFKLKVSEQSSYGAWRSTVYCPSGSGTSCLFNIDESFYGFKYGTIHARNTERVILNGNGQWRFGSTKIYVDNAKTVYIHCDGSDKDSCNGMHIYMVYNT